MRLIFSGFNATSKKIDKFEINICDSSCFESNESLKEKFNLKSIHCTFDCFYYISANRNVFYFDYEKKIFRILMKLNDTSSNDYLISSCSNTNYLWCLISTQREDKFDRKLEIRQYSNNHLIDQIRLEDNVYKTVEDLDELFILSTDINFYLFHNSKKGLKCIFELKSSNDLSVEKMSVEKNLNESAISSIPINKILIKDRIKQASTGNEHILFLTEHGQVYSFGLGTKGQLGHGSIDNHYEPKLIDSISDIVAISANGWHSTAINRNRDCYIWGNNLNSQLGVHNDEVLVTKPFKLEIQNDLNEQRVEIRKISIGTRHSALIDDTGRIFTFGWNKYQQTFHDASMNDIENEICLPKELLDLKCSTKCNCELICGKWYTLIQQSTS
jgi:alpha-tubulin suppressor-like RCC1 family protein